MTDTDLLIGFRRGEARAAEALWSSHAPRLVAYARARLAAPHRHHAEDVVQQVFLTVLKRSAAELRDVRDVAAWLVRLTRNASINFARGERRHADRARAATPAEQHDDTPHDPVLQDALAALPDAQRDVVLLHQVAGLTFDQIELATGVNRNTAASRHRAALAALHDRLQAAAQTVPGDLP